MEYQTRNLRVRKGITTMKKILGIFICILFIVTSLPVSGFTINVNENNVVFRHDHFEDYPGYMTTLYPKFSTPKISHIDSKHHNKMLSSIDNNIIDMILQIDDSMVLRYLENLTAFGPRVTGTPECYAAGNYIYNEFVSMGLDVRFHDWSYGGYTDRNVEATLYGTNSSNDEIYVICAHFDSVPESPGADDDGSGIAAVLSAAYIISQYNNRSSHPNEFNYTIRFVTFSGEEEGLYGSYKYAEEAYANSDNIVGTLNADMMGHAVTTEGGNKVTIRQNEASIWLTDFIVNVSQLYHEYINLEIIPEFDPHGYSDHYRFWQYGYDAIQYREFETNPYYHTPDDTIENMNVTYSKKCSKLALATLAELAQSCEINLPPNPPTINGPTSGKTNTAYQWNFTAIDPDNDDVLYQINWDDGTITDWLGAYPSGETIQESHAYTAKGTYTIKCKAKDIYGNESDWGQLSVTMPFSYEPQFPFISWLLERFPNGFPLLRHMMGN